MRILPVIMAVSLTAGPLTVYGARKGEAAPEETIEEQTEQTTQSAPAAAQEPAEEPAPAPAEEPAPAPTEEPAPDPAPQGDQGEGSGDQGGQGGDPGTVPGDTPTDPQDPGTQDPIDPTDPTVPAEEGGDPVPGEPGTEDPSLIPGEETPVEETAILDPEEEALPEGVELTDDLEGSNEALIAAQHIVSLPVPKSDFRFYSMPGTAALLKNASYIYGKRSTSSAKVGQADKYCAVSVLEKGDGWAYIETMNVRGFVPASQLALGKDKDSLLADRDTRTKTLRERVLLLELRIQQARLLAPGSLPASLQTLTIEKEAAARELQQLEDSAAPSSTALVPWYENEAFLYLKGTSLNHVADKEYALSAGKASVYETPSLSSREVGALEKDTLLYILQKNGSWYYVESGEVRGYVRSSDLRTGREIQELVTDRKEDSFASATELVAQAENHALYDTISSIRDGVKENPIRRQILELAEKSIGCPYVWGGTDLYHGADCSGFVQTLYRHFGYSIPRVAADQARYGTQIPVEDALPGDLIFFARNGYVYHVAMYWGDGVTIEAYSSGRGITQVANVTSRDAVWACRILE